MGEYKEQLPILFDADTDLLLQSCLDGYKKYAQWFEKSSVKQINYGLEKENIFFEANNEQCYGYFGGWDFGMIFIVS